MSSALTARAGRPRRLRSLFLTAFVLLSLPSERAAASPYVAPGDSSFRSDLQLLADERIMLGAPLVWPLSWNDVIAGLESPDAAEALDAASADALMRVRERLSRASQLGAFLQVRAAYTDDAPLIRSFEAENRESGEATLGLAWTTERFAAEINVTRAHDAPRDEYRLDGSHFSVALGNWAFGVGTQDRWWGPGWQGSLVLGTNARPVRQLSVRKIGATAFERPWLRWIGPWTIDSFIGELDDERVVDDAKLFGVRVTAMPLPGLTVGLSRTAQFCGGGRRCDAETFGRLLLGKDNRGVNVGEEEEPGNQLAGVDVRFAFAERPLAVYAQWIGEDTRQGGPQIGDLMRQLGVEHWGALRARGWRYRAMFEVSDTVCRQGGTGFGQHSYNCAYEHSIYHTGYRYEGRSIGHSIDSDGRSLTLGAVINGPAGKSWTVLAQSADINEGPAFPRSHGISQTPVDFVQLSVSHRRKITLGELVVRLRHERIDDPLADAAASDTSASIEWRFGY